MTIQDSFEAPIAYNPTTDELVTGAIFTVYAVDDIALATPLAVTDPVSGAAISPLTSSSIGVLPSFAVAGDPAQVILKSGTFVTLLTSKYGIFLDVVPDPDQLLDAIASAAVAEAARDAALAAQEAAEAVPSTTDALIAGRINAAGSDTDTALKGRSVVFREASSQRMSALDHGVQQSTSVDSSAALQSLIDAVAADVLASSFERSRTVFVPGGRYRLNSRIVQPPYVKVIAEGTVVFETHVAGDSAWHVTPLATDPVDPTAGVLNKQQWNSGAILDAVGGNIVFINKVGTRTGQTALELGSRTNLTAARPLARYEVANVCIEEYGVGVKWNAFNHYICTYRRILIEECDTHVKYGDGVVVVNSGEKVAWVDCIFGVGAAGKEAHLIDCDTINVQFFNCSHDYLSCVVRFTSHAGYQRVDFFGGHVERINLSPRYDAAGGWAVSDVATGIVPEVAIHGTTFASFERDTVFKGNLSLSANFDYRGTQTTSLPAANAYLCADTVEVLDWRVRQWNAYALPSRRLNGVPDSTLKLQTTAADVAAVSGWTVSAGSGVTGTVTADGPVSGDKALSLVFAAASYRRFTPNPRMPIRPGQRLRATLAFNRTVTLALQLGATFYDHAGNVISTVSAASLTLGAVTGAWVYPVNPRRTGLEAPPGAASVAPFWDLTSSAGSAGVAQKFSDFYAWVE